MQKMAYKKYIPRAMIPWPETLRTSQQFAKKYNTTCNYSR